MRRLLYHDNLKRDKLLPTYGLSQFPTTISNFQAPE